MVKSIWIASHYVASLNGYALRCVFAIVLFFNKGCLWAVFFFEKILVTISKIRYNRDRQRNRPHTQRNIMNLILKPKNDLVFKLLLEANKANLKSFLIATLGIKPSDIVAIDILNPHSKLDKPNDKITIMDLKLELTLTLKTQIINIEIQLNKTPHMNDRVLYGIAKSLTEQKHKGSTYKLKKVISILITDYTLTDTHTNYHDIYKLTSPTTNTRFSDTIEIHTIELPKLPAQPDGTPLYNWATLLKAENEEDLTMLAAQAPELKDIIFTLRELSQDDKARLHAEAREAWLGDQLAREEYALAQGIEQGIEQGIYAAAKKMRQSGMSAQMVADMMELDIAVVERLV